MKTYSRRSDILDRSILDDASHHTAHFNGGRGWSPWRRQRSWQTSECVCGITGVPNDICGALNTLSAGQCTCGITIDGARGLVDGVDDVVEASSRSIAIECSRPSLNGGRDALDQRS